MTLQSWLILWGLALVVVFGAGVVVTWLSNRAHRWRNRWEQ